MAQVPEPPGAFRGSGQAPGEVDLEYNLVVNLVESVSSQGGAAGPATTLLGDLAVPVPAEWHLQGEGEGEGAVE